MCSPNPATSLSCCLAPPSCYRPSCCFTVWQSGPCISHPAALCLSHPATLRSGCLTISPSHHLVVSPSASLYLICSSCCPAVLQSAIHYLACLAISQTCHPAVYCLAPGHSHLTIPPPTILLSHLLSCYLAVSLSDNLAAYHLTSCHPTILLLATLTIFRLTHHLAIWLSCCLMSLILPLAVCSNSCQ